MNFLNEDMLLAIDKNEQKTNKKKGKSVLHFALLSGILPRILLDLF